MPTVYIRQDNHERILKLGMNPSTFVNDLIDKSFIVDVKYTPLVKPSNDGERQTAIETEKHATKPKPKSTPQK